MQIEFSDTDHRDERIWDHAPYNLEIINRVEVAWGERLKQFESKDELVLKVDVGINNFVLKPHTGGLWGLLCLISFYEPKAKGACLEDVSILVFLMEKCWNNHAFSSHQLTVFDLTWAIEIKQILFQCCNMDLWKEELDN